MFIIPYKNKEIVEGETLSWEFYIEFCQNVHFVKQKKRRKKM